MANGLSTNQTFQDSTVTFVDNLDNTKVGAFQLSGITAGNTRTLTWPDSSGTIALTSSIASIFDATVGATGADYTTVSGALAASKNRLLVIDDVTEVGACAVPAAGLFIYILKGKNINMGANQFTFAASNNLTIIGQENDSSKVTFAFTAATNTELIDTGANTASVATLQNLTIDNNSTQSGCKVQLEDSIAVYENIWYEPPNVANCGIYLSNPRSKVVNVWVTAPGTTATDVLRVDSGQITNATMIGTFTNSNDPVTIGSDDGVLTNFISTGNCKIAINGGTLENVRESGGTLNIDVDSADQSRLVNVQLAAGTVTVGSACDRNRFVNCELATLTLSATSQDNQFVNCEITNNLTVNCTGGLFENCLFNGTVTFASDYGQMSNCRLASSLTVNSGSTRNIFSNCNIIGAVTLNDQTVMTGCKVGADAGGGANTITVAAGSTNTVLTGCITDAAISDSGTTTQISNCVTY